MIGTRPKSSSGTGDSKRSQRPCRDRSRSAVSPIPLQPGISGSYRPWEGVDLSRTAVIIPSLNEAARLTKLLPLLTRMSLGQILLCDNGSTDDTHAVVEGNTATWVYEPQRGYGSACWAGVERLSPDIEIVVFIDADLSDDPLRLPDLVKPILSGTYDFVLGARVAELLEPGCMTFLQRVSIVLLPLMIRIGWGHHYHDLGPFRAIRRSALDEMGMRDRAFGWTAEMQIRAVEMGLRILEIPVAYRKRKGRSKISGSVRGTIRAARGLLGTCARLWFTKGRRARQADCL